MNPIPPTNPHDPRPGPVLRAAIEATDPMVAPHGLPQYLPQIAPDPSPPVQFLMPPAPDPNGWRMR